MPKGFGRLKKNKKVKPYAPLNTEEKRIITAIEELGYKHGKDFLFEKRTHAIYKTSKLTPNFEQIVSTIKSLGSEESRKIIDKIEDSAEVEDISSTEFNILAREAIIWKIHKEIYSVQPQLINGFFDYSENLQTVLTKYDELISQDEDENTIDGITLVTEYIMPFWQALEKKGYIYDFVSASE